MWVIIPDNDEVGRRGTPNRWPDRDRQAKDQIIRTAELAGGAPPLGDWLEAGKLPKKSFYHWPNRRRYMSQKIAQSRTKRRCKGRCGSRRRQQRILVMP